MTNITKENALSDLFSRNYSQPMRPLHYTTPHLKTQSPPVDYDSVSQSSDPHIYLVLAVTLPECYNGTLKELDVERTVFIYSNALIMTQKQKETVAVEIEKGILHNETLVIEKKGHIVKKNNESICGNLVITLSINTMCANDIVCFLNRKQIPLNEKDYYEKKSNNLVYHKHISLKEALCGFDFIVPHLNREFYRIKSSPNVIFPHDKLHYINNNGFIRNSICGDFLIHYHVVFPTTLDSYSIEQLRKIL